MVDDLVVWLRAQLDEDERVANNLDELANYERNGIESTAGGQVVDYLDRFSSDRVLAEVDAKRRVLDLFEYEQVDVSLPWGPPATAPGKRPATAGPVLRLLALPYADRPGYRDEWKP